MSRAEILATRYGEMLDMIACIAIAHGEKPRNKQKMSILDTLEVV